MTPDPVTTDNRPEGDFNVTQVWLDALARGTCDEEAFLRAVQMLTRRSPEAAWDSLALLDQYFRRGKIKQEVFKRVKSRLGSQLLGPALDVELSVPLRRPDSQQAPAAVVVPVPSSAASAITAPLAAAPSPVGPSPVARSPVAPAPAAPSPVAPASAAPSPVAPAPVAPASAAPSPVAPSPVTPAPVAPASAAPSSAAPGSVAPSPVTPASAAPSPIAPAPAAPAAAAPAPAPAPSTPPPAVTPAPSRGPAPLATAHPPSPAPEPIREMAAPQVTSAPPSRGATNAALRAAASAASGRTVPIGVESTSIPMLDPVDWPIEQPGRSSAARQVTVGDVLRGRYVIKNILGLGGTGTVFEAIDRYRLDLPDSGQRVAVKVLHSDTAEQSAVLANLRREFQLLQSLSHPNIVRAHEYDRDGDTAFFTMEYLSGLSLESVLSAHREVVLERTHALIIIRDVAAALEHAHSRGVVHGDLNPGNIFITNDGAIRVLDFGAAHTPSRTPSMIEAAWDATAYATPRYASCQLLDGERADARDDTYALACVLYVLLAGKHPFGELNAAQARAQRLKPRRPTGLTGKQWHALRTGLSFDRQRRPADIAAWLEPFDLPKPETRLPVLLALLKAAPRRSRRSGAAAVSIVVLLALAATGWWASGHMDLVSQTAADAGVDLKGAVATTDAALTRLWVQARTSLSSSPVPQTQPPAAASTESSAAPEGGPSTARPSEASSTATSPSVRASAPAARIPSPRTAVPAMAGPVSSAGVPPRSSPAAQPSHARIELTADTVDVPSTDPAAHVIVKRTGNLHADTGFTWWTESGTAKPGQDFMNVKAHEEHFEDGKSVANLFVPVVSDPARKQPKSFYIVINDPTDGASLGKRTLTMVTIPPAD